MADLPTGGRERRPAPELPAFCRTRRHRSSLTSVRLSTMQQLQWLLWLVLALQLSTLLLLLAGPGPAPGRLMGMAESIPIAAAQLTPCGELPAGAVAAGAIASRNSAALPTVPSAVQP